MTTIAEIKEEVSAEVYLEYLGVSIPSWGGWNDWIAVKCPFHYDVTPSASYNRSKDLFNCHGCGVAGDVIDLVQEGESLTTVREAMTWIEANLIG